MAKNMLNNEQIDFIKKSIDSKEVSSRRAKEIRKMFPEIFAMIFKKGDWVICDDAETPKAQRILYVNDTHYGTSNDFGSLGYNKNKSGLRLATNEEIQKVLYNISKSRGYRAGDRITPVYDTTVKEWKINKVTSKNPNYDPKNFNGEVFSLYGTVVYCEGKWADIIEDEFVDPKIALDTLKSIDDISKGIERLIKNLKTLKDEIKN